MWGRRAAEAAQQKRAAQAQDAARDEAARLQRDAFSRSLAEAREDCAAGRSLAEASSPEGKGRAAGPASDGTDFGAAVVRAAKNRSPRSSPRSSSRSSPRSSPRLSRRPPEVLTEAPQILATPRADSPLLPLVTSTPCPSPASSPEEKEPFHETSSEHYSWAAEPAVTIKEEPADDVGAMWTRPVDSDAELEAARAEAAAKQEAAQAAQEER
eukprot:COSAG04_NODE_271_length_18505_cov_15.097957_3_plen_212_part_00